MVSILKILYQSEKLMQEGSCNLKEPSLQMTPAKRPPIQVNIVEKKELWYESRRDHHNWEKKLTQWYHENEKGLLYVTTIMSKKLRNLPEHWERS